LQQLESISARTRHCGTFPKKVNYSLQHLFVLPSLPSVFFTSCLSTSETRGNTIRSHFVGNAVQSLFICEAGSSVGIVTELRAGRSGIESRWGRDFPPVQTGPGAQPATCTMGTESFPGVKCGRGVLLTTHPLLVPRSWKSRAIPLPTLWATPGL